MNSALGQFLQSLFAILKTDSLSAALPVIQDFLTNIQANPSPANITAQATLLPATLLANLPNLEAAVAKDLTALLQTEVTALVGMIQNPPSASAPVKAKLTN